ncbi:hypothetical protein PR002_g30124, partial [Phytophthora rubi]
MFSRFPEVLLVDSSHKTNRHDYQLLTFMSIDERWMNVDASVR